MGKRHSKELKEEILGKIRLGMKVREAAIQYGISEPTVRSWMDRELRGEKSEILELSRLKRENEMLLKLVGQLTYESELEKKNQLRRGHS